MICRVASRLRRADGPDTNAAYSSPVEGRRDLAAVSAGALVALVVCTYLASIHNGFGRGRLTTGWAVAALAGAALVALTIDRFRGRRTPRVVPVVLVVALSCLLAVMPCVQLAWVAVLAVALAALIDWDIAMSALLALLPLIAMLWFALRTAQPGLNAMVNALICLLVFAFVIWRGQRQEALDLQRAQQRAIDAAQARADHVAAQQALAAQLHDILAHTLSGLTVTLQGAGVLAGREGVSDDLRQRIDVATGLAKDGLREARSAVESLRGTASESVDLAPWLATTVERLRSGTGMSVEVTGDAALVPARRVALARAVLTEGLTNALRHASGAPAVVRCGSGGVAVVTTGAGTELGHTSGGHGLAGLAERATREGARLTGGPTATGFEVSVSWPEASA